MVDDLEKIQGRWVLTLEVPLIQVLRLAPEALPRLEGSESIVVVPVPGTVRGRRLANAVSDARRRYGPVFARLATA